MKRRFRIFLSLLLLAGASRGAQSPAPELLTPAERAWLERHPEIVLGVGNEWPPWVVVQDDGSVGGFAADHARLLGRKLGVEIRLQAGPWQEIVAKAERGELAGLTLSAPLQEREAHFLFTNVFQTAHYFVYLRTGESLPSGSLDAFQGKRVGYLEGNLRIEKLLAGHPGIAAVPMVSQEALAQGLLRGDVDAAVGSYALEYWRASNGIFGFTPSRILFDSATDLVISVRKDWPELVAILNKGLSAVTSDETAALFRRWFGPEYTRHAATVAVPLSTEERVWLAAHPDIVIGAPQDQPPAVVVGNDGALSGIVIDYVDLLNRRLGTDIRVTIDQWPKVVERGVRRDIDLLGFVFELDTHRRHFDFTEKVINTYYYIYARSDDPRPPKGLDDLSGKRVGYTASTRIVEEMAGQRGDIELVPFADSRSLANGLLSGRVDAVLSNVSFEYWRKQHTQTGFRIAALVPEMGGDLVIAVRNDWPELTGILNKGLASITETERQAILNRWVGSDASVEPQRPSIELTAEEQAWLGSDPVVRVSIDPHWAPVAFVDDDGVAQGMAVSFLRRLSELVGLRFSLTTDHSWSEAWRRLESGQLDMLPTIAETDERRQRVRFTEPYLSLPVAIFSAAEVAYLGGLDALKGKTVAVVQDDVMQGRLQQDWPELDLVPVADTKEALRTLASGKALAFVGNLVTTSYYIGQTGLSQIKVAGETPYTHDLSIGVRAGLPLLAAILQKGLDAIPKSERDAIYHEWISIKYEHSVDYTRFTLALIAAASVLLVVFYWNRRLVSEVDRRRKAEAELREAKDAAEQASRSKGAFLANTSHELRTPLNAILGFAQVLQGDDQLTGSQKRHADAIRRGAERLLGLISELLDLAKIEAGRLELVPIPWETARLFDELAETYLARIKEKGLRLQVRITSRMPAVLRGDVKRIYQVLSNLLDNAVKYTTRGRIDLAADFAEGQLIVEVVDTGSGIPEQRQATIFEPFEQLGDVEQRSKGMGLGLAISKRLVDFMGGTIEVDSTPGQGSRFRVCIPAEAASSEIVPVGEKRSTVRLAGYRRTVGEGRLRVLVVDDEPENRGIVRGLLEPLGFEVEEADDGGACVQKAMERRPDLIVMDMVMPKLDGLEATRMLRDVPASREIAIIALSAAAFPEDRQQALAAGCDAYLSKPVFAEELMKTLGELLPLEWLREPPVPITVEKLDFGALPVEAAADLQRFVDTGNMAAVDALARDLTEKGCCPELARQIEQLAEAFDLGGLRKLLEAKHRRGEDAEVIARLRLSKG